MATIINTPPSSDNGSGAGIVIGVILAIILIALFVIYGLPAIRQNQESQPSETNIIVTPPPTINITPPPTY